MKKRRYRIKIETEKSGKKWYRAEEKGFLRWNFITLGGYLDYGYDYSVETIQEAENAIDDRLANLEEEDSEKIINIEYKYL